MWLYKPLKFSPFWWMCSLLCLKQNNAPPHPAPLNSKVSLLLDMSIQFTGYFLIHWFFSLLQVFIVHEPVFFLGSPASVHTVLPRILGCLFFFRNHLLISYHFYDGIWYLLSSLFVIFFWLVAFYFELHLYYRYLTDSLPDILTDITGIWLIFRVLTDL